jgi:DNA-binding response OmpR family regulator
MAIILMTRTPTGTMSSPPKLMALIIDDESDICFLLGNILEQKNIRSLYAGSLAEATKTLQSHPDPSFIFLDNHLPDGFGISYISELKREHPLSLIIMITAHDTNADRRKAEEYGADFFIGKPFSKETIFKTD